MTRVTAIKRVLIACFILSVLAGALMLLRWSNEESIGHTVTYSDGTTLTLMEVTYGTDHRYRGGGLRERLISLLPRQYASKFASRRNLLTTQRPSVVFWFDRRGTPARTGDLVLCDGSGFGVMGGYSMMRLDPPNGTIEGWAYQHFPRRAPVFTVRVYERGKHYGEATLQGEFKVRNPRQARYPVWTASPLPLTVSGEDLVVMLFDLTAGVGHGSMKWQPMLSPTSAETRAGFRVARNGKPTKEWEITSVEASDATGNVISEIWSSSSGPDAEYVDLSPHLWPAESAWKLHVGFSQRSNFVASELWTLHGVPLSGIAFTNSQVMQTNLQGALVQYTGETRRSGLNGTHHFNFLMVPARPEYRMTLVKAVDDLGRDAKVESWHESWSERTFALNVNTNAKTIDLTVALHRTRYLEFLARPQIISTNAAASP